MGHLVDPDRDPGELLHVAADQRITSRTAVQRPPAHPLALADLHPRAAASQQANAAHHHEVDK